MALSSTLYRFKIKLSDVDRGIYETVELRVPMHPSESHPFLLTRVLAYCLNLQEGLEFSAGIAAPDDPTLCAKDLTGALKLWVEIGNPSARRLHKASKSSEKVRVYTYRDPEILKTEMRGAEIFRREDIEIFFIPPAFLNQLAAFLARDNAWEFLHHDGQISIAGAESSAAAEMVQIRP